MKKITKRVKSIPTKRLVEVGFMRRIRIQSYKGAYIEVWDENTHPEVTVELDGDNFIFTYGTVSVVVPKANILYWRYSD